VTGRRGRLGKLEARRREGAAWGVRVWELAPDSAGYVCRESGERRGLLALPDTGPPPAVLSELPGGKWIAGLDAGLL
jgi:hypothetical protein